MRFFKNAVVAALCVAALLVARPAQSIPTTTTGGGTVLLGGTVVLVLYLAKVGPFAEKDGGTTTDKHVQLSPEERKKLAGAYLRELGPTLTEGIATGRAELVNDWARALKLPAGHEAKLAQVLHANRAELLALVGTEKLTDERAAAFLERLSVLVNADSVLQKDMDALRASAQG